MKVAEVKVGEEYLVSSSAFKTLDKRRGEEARKRMKAGDDPEGELFRLFYVPHDLQSAYSMNRVRVIETGLPYGKKRRRTGVKVSAEYEARVVLGPEPEPDLEKLKRLQELVRDGLIGDDEALERLMEDIPETTTETRNFECVLDASSLVDPIEYEVERFRFDVRLHEWNQQDEATRPTFEEMLRGD